MFQCRAFSIYYDKIMQNTQFNMLSYKFSYIQYFNQNFENKSIQNSKMTSSHDDLIYAKIKERLQNHPQRQKNLLIQIQPPRMNIKFNRPKRYNAFSMDMYESLTQNIIKAQQMDNIKFIVFSGQGGNFTSGNDLTNFTNPIITELGDFPDIVKASSRILLSVTQAVIKCKKPIVAITQGKVIGFAFTLLALLDKVFAVQNSQFSAPLVSSGQGPQFCASYTFPKIFGMSIAEQLVTFGETVDAGYLQKYNFVQKCKTRKQADEKLSIYLQKINQLDWFSYVNARRLYRQRQQKVLLEVAERELNNLLQRWMNPNLLSNIAKHMQKMKNIQKKNTSAKL